MGGDQEEPGMIIQVIRKAPEEKASNCPHNNIIIDQSILSIFLTTGTKIISFIINLVGMPRVLGAVFILFM